MQKTNCGVGRGVSRRRVASTRAPGDGGAIAGAQSDVLMLPGQPRHVTNTFDVTKEPVSISVYGLCGGDELFVEQVELVNGCPPNRNGCRVSMGSDPVQAFVMPLLADCDPVSLSECQPRIILDQVGTYRLKLLSSTGCQADCSLGNVLVKKSIESVARGITPAMRGYGGGPASGDLFTKLIATFMDLNETQKAVLRGLLGAQIDIDTLACALDCNDNAKRQLAEALAPFIPQED